MYVFKLQKIMYSVSYASFKCDNDKHVQNFEVHHMCQPTIT